MRRSSLRLGGRQGASLNTVVAEEFSAHISVKMTDFFFKKAHESIRSFIQLEFPFLNKVIHFNPLNAELNPIRHLLALVGARHIVHASRIRVKAAA